jgi:hypothetical protein
MRYVHRVVGVPEPRIRGQGAVVHLSRGGVGGPVHLLAAGIDLGNLPGKQGCAEGGRVEQALCRTLLLLLLLGVIVTPHGVVITPHLFQACFLQLRLPLFLGLRDELGEGQAVPVSK